MWRELGSYTSAISGMVLEAVREDRMPGGRNGSAIYNLYKMKYRKCENGSGPQSGGKRRSSASAPSAPNQEPSENDVEIRTKERRQVYSSSGEEKDAQSSMEDNLDISSSSSSSLSFLFNENPPASSISVNQKDTAEYSLSNPTTAEDKSDMVNDHMVNKPGFQIHVMPVRKNLIQKLIEIDRLEDLINLRGLRIRTPEQNIHEQIGPTERLSHIGDEIVEHLVEWTKLLPFYNELPIEVHTHLLTNRWAELVLLSTCFYALYYGHSKTRLGNLMSGENAINDAMSPVDVPLNLRLLQCRLSAVMDRHIPLEHIVREAGTLVEQFTVLFYGFGRLRITREAYVCLKAITILHCNLRGSSENSSQTIQVAEPYVRKVQLIQERFVKALQIHLSHFEDGPKLTEIFTWMPQLQSASAVLLRSKMFYVPFLICKRPEQLIENAANSILRINEQQLQHQHQHQHQHQQPENDETDSDGC